ncbi:sigma-54-dependent transcriptional regulator [Caldithrix abyssi]|uniref:Two component, sigma54 specific, transcriptional regulator, Fis family n=1 Tax=Caldithrix abyssi DSM 13497 TaxID=880073 RepID=H1XTQ5_CALAY|nr:sigma-54 dependent transcriptional regulator [Caldithrix abyssi]APF17428.1 two-component system, NtrC family, response regulator AtoC [Caldithrix abyssi DSM 13497]EHO41530.1 two component, sigma54 specific, transcriptional regulator, Fis family [Caldithrix abyssi DSM 13497]
MKARILIVDDERDALDLMREVFEKKGYTPVTALNGLEAINIIKQQEPDVILTDIRMPEMDGMELLRVLTKDYPHIPVIMVTAHGTIETAVDAMKMGAKDYILKPIRINEILSKVERITQLNSLIKENEYLLSKLKQTYDFTNMIGKTENIRKLFDLVKDVAATNTTVLIEGESGVGKELIANAIHYNSPRAKRPFVKINCGVLAESLLESELFGHVRGAFTGAIRDKIGRFEMANGGTLFLDEIGDISLNMQLKLLRVLQEGEFERVGGTETIKVDVRIIAATNKDLKKAMQEGTFRQDLYYRLNVIPIRVPPLRERREDIKYLTYHFIEKFNKIYGKNVMDIEPEAMDILEKYDYPGNIRELENLIERIIVLNKKNIITVKDLPENIRNYVGEFNTEKIDFSRGFNQLVEDYEKNLIIKALEQNKFNKVQTAKMLKMNRSTLISKLKKYQID